MRSFLNISFILFVTVAIAQPDSYIYKRQLNKTENAGYYSIPLIPEITARSKSDLNDLRLYNIIGNDTAEVPYLMEWLGNKTEEKAVPFELINDTYNQKCCSYVTLKFPGKQIINRIKLDVVQSNFDKILKIEGSNDNKEWFTIAEHMRIVRFQNMTEKFSYTSLDFQNTEYSYFRLKFDDDSNDKITVTNAYAFVDKLTEGNYHPVKFDKLTQAENKKNKTSELILEFPYNYFHSYLTLKSSSKDDFYRNMLVYRSNGTYKTATGDKEDWVVIGSGVITSNKLNKIPLYNTQTKKLKIEISNYDNQPVVSDVNAVDIHVFSEAIELVSLLPVSENMYLAYGKENANSPVYDLVHFRQKIPEDPKVLNYGSEEVKPATPKIVKQQLITNKTWLWISMSIVILIIGYFALSMLRKEQHEK